MKKKLKLTIEMVPESTWEKNLRNFLGPDKWRLIRKDVYWKANYKCQICGAEPDRGKLHCHEIWGYDDKNFI